MARKTNKITKSATQTCTERGAAIAKKLAKLQARIATMNADVAAGKKLDWGDAGDFGYILEKLGDLEESGLI